MQVNIYQTKTRLSALAEQVRQGQTVVIAKNGTPLAKLVALDALLRPSIVYALMKGEIEMADDFDAPLPADLLILPGAADAAEPTPPNTLPAPGICCWTPTPCCG